MEDLQQWFDAHWEEAEDASVEVLKVMERQTRNYMPFEVYVKSLQTYFNNYEETAGEWERHQSRMYPILDQYQRDGYGALLKIGGKYGGAFLCNGVGLGKIFVGLMLIERLVKFERKPTPAGEFTGTLLPSIVATHQGVSLSGRAQRI